MTQQDIKDFIITYLKNKIPPLKDKVLTGAEAFDSRELYFDSIEFIELCLALEEKTGVQVTETLHSSVVLTIDALSRSVWEKQNDET